MDEGWIIAIGTAAGVLLGSIGAFCVSLMTKFQTMRRETRADALSEWSAIVSRLDLRNKELHDQILSLYTDNATCMRQNAELSAKIIIHEARIASLEEALRTAQISAPIPNITDDPKS